MHVGAVCYLLTWLYTCFIDSIQLTACDITAHTATYMYILYGIFYSQVHTISGSSFIWFQFSAWGYSSSLLYFLSVWGHLFSLVYGVNLPVWCIGSLFQFGVWGHFSNLVYEVLPVWCVKSFHQIGVWAYSVCVWGHPFNLVIRSYFKFCGLCLSFQFWLWGLFFQLSVCGHSSRMLYGSLVQGPVSI